MGTGCPTCFRHICGCCFWPLQPASPPLLLASPTGQPHPSNTSSYLFKASLAAHPQMSTILHFPGHAEILTHSGRLTAMHALSAEAVPALTPGSGAEQMDTCTEKHCLCSRFFKCRRSGAFQPARSVMLKAMTTVSLDLSPPMVVSRCLPAVVCLRGLTGALRLLPAAACWPGLSSPHLPAMICQTPVWSRANREREWMHS